jgi:hypothetical protein
LLFLIYMNDMDTNKYQSWHRHQANTLCWCFDDTSILITGKDIKDLTLNLDKINKSITPWFDNNWL